MVSIFGNARFMVCIAPGGGAAVHAYIPFAFQFHMVQLEHEAFFVPNRICWGFQFHYGSIRTDNGRARIWIL